MHDTPADGLGKSRKIAPLIPSTGNEPNRSIDALQRFEGGIDIRTLRIVYKLNPSTLANDLKGMFQSGKRRQAAADRVERTPAEQSMGGSRHDVADIMVSDNTDLVSAANLLPNTRNRRHNPVAFEVGCPRYISADCRRGGKPQTYPADMMSQRGHAIIVKIEDGEIRYGLIFEDPLFRRDIVVQRLITVLVIDRHIEQSGDPRMEPIDRFKLKAGNL